MSFRAREASVEAGVPVLLYRFSLRLAGGRREQTFLFTDGETPKRYAGDTYAPIPVKMGAVKQSGTLDDADVTVSLPHDNQVARLFRYFPPAAVVTVTVFAGHEDTDDYVMVWRGRVLQVKLVQNEARLTCEAAITTLRRPQLLRLYNHACPHGLYTPACGARRHTDRYPVRGAANGVVTFRADWAPRVAPPKYLGGTAAWDNAGGAPMIHQIIGHADKSLTLAGPTDGLAAGDSIDLTAGCNHQMDDCQTLHRNIHNFGGQPWIPLKNPFTVTNLFA